METGGERKKYLTAHNFVKFRRNKFNLPFIFNNTSVLIVPIIYCPDRKEKCYLESSFQLRKLHLNQILPFFFAGHGFRTTRFIRQPRSHLVRIDKRIFE